MIDPDSLKPGQPLPPIRIQRSRTYEDRGKGVEPCLICGKAVNHETAHWVGVDADLRAVDPSTDPELGCYPIGPDCWRNHPELHPYKV